MFVHSLWTRDQDSSKQKLLTINFQTTYFYIDYGFTDTDVLLFSRDDNFFCFTQYSEALPKVFCKKCVTRNFAEFRKNVPEPFF